VTWTTSGDGTPPPAGPFAFSIIDQQHLVVVLGTGVDYLDVDWVHVWQMPGQGPCIGENCGPLTNAPDTSPPSTPANLTATPVSSSQINLSWSRAIDNVGVTSYGVYRGGSQIATTTATSYQDAALMPSTTYTYTVTAFDAAANTTAPSSPASATTQTVPAFLTGDRIKTTAKVTVRTTASSTSAPAGTQQKGSAGTVIGGPVQADGSPWWNINFDKGPDGWVQEQYLVKSASTQSKTVLGTSLPISQTFTRQLDVGTKGDDVALLQRVLSSHDSIYPEKLVTGYFGSLTQAAVSRFQESNDLAAVGRVGPLTLLKLNELLGL
jgi:peptidoglycan hydrolase-like protein with peptidoglycan-binding domain